MTVRGKGGKKRKRRASAYATAHNTIPARARQANMSVRSLYAQIAKGIGPRITFLSARRRTIEDPDWDEWMRGRRDNPPAEVTSASSPNPRAASFKPRESTEAAP
jgi:hypothetical protein